MKNERSARLRARLKEKRILMAPAAHDGLCARIYEKAGFEAIYLSGFATSSSFLGRPDVGLLDYSEMLYRASTLADVVDVPIFADGDTGFGNAVNVYRTVRGYVNAGVSAIQLEDQVAPKKCGHMHGREVVPMEEMIGKIHAACDARTDDNFMIIARTDARTNFGIDAAIERGMAYKEAGADIVFVESPESVDELKKVAAAFPDVPTIANMVEFGRTPLLTADELEAMGFNIMIIPVLSTFVIAKAVSEAAAVLMKDRSSKNLLDRSIDFNDFTELLGLPQVRAMEEKYATGRHVSDN